VEKKTNSRNGAFPRQGRGDSLVYSGAGSGEDKEFRFFFLSGEIFRSQFGFFPGGEHHPQVEDGGTPKTTNKNVPNLVTNRISTGQSPTKGGGNGANEIQEHTSLEESKRGD